MPRAPRFQVAHEDVDALSDGAAENPRAVTGDNRPPPTIADAVEAFEAEFAKLDKRLAELRDSLARAPEKVEDDDVAKAFVTLGKQMNLLADDFEHSRVMAPFKPFLDAVDAARARVKTALEAVAGHKATIYRRVEPYVLALPEGQQTVTNEHGNRAYLTSRKGTVECIDPSVIPAGFLTPDMKLVKAEYDAGRTVPGFEFIPTAKKVVIS